MSPRANSAILSYAPGAGGSQQYAQYSTPPTTTSADFSCIRSREPAEVLRPPIGAWQVSRLTAPSAAVTMPFPNERTEDVHNRTKLIRRQM